MIQIQKDDLLEMQMDLTGLSNMLVVIESSEYYNEEDASIFRALRNSVDYTKRKLDNIIEIAKG